MSIVFKNIRVIDSLTDKETNILINGDSFYEIPDINQSFNENYVIEGENLVLLPSFIDMHCHLRDPGYTYKEDLYSGQLAALSGGFTSICCMANTKPVCDNKETIQNIKDRAKYLNMCDVFPISAVTRGLDTDNLVDFAEMTKYTRLFSNDGKPINNAETMIKALKASSKFHFKLLTHCEPETEMIERDIKLLELYGGNLHVCHVSKKESVELIRRAKEKGLNVTCEATPHHLYDFGLDYIVHPPFRKKVDKDALLEGLLNGTIDIIATDHAPHSKKDKLKGAAGLIGFEHAFSLVYTTFKKNNIDIKLISKLMSEYPAKLLKITSVNFLKKSKADFILVDLNKKYKINEERIISKGKNTPFIGHIMDGQVMMTLKNGDIKYEHN